MSLAQDRIRPSKGPEQACHSRTTWLYASDCPATIPFMKTHPFLCLSIALSSICSSLPAADLPLVSNVDWQPFSSQVKRVVEATDLLGTPFSSEDKTTLAKLLEGAESKDSLAKLQSLLDAHCLFGIQINPEMRVKVAQGPARPELVEKGWRVFLVKVQNDSGTTADLRALSPNAVSLFEPSNTASDKEFKTSIKPDPNDCWLDLQMFDAQPLRRKLSGLPLDYRIVQLYSRDAGKREARVSFNVGQGTQDLGFRNDADVL